MTWGELLLHISAMAPKRLDDPVLFRRRVNNCHDAPENQPVVLENAIRALANGDETVDDWPDPVIQKGQPFLTTERRP